MINCAVLLLLLNSDIISDIQNVNKRQLEHTLFIHVVLFLERIDRINVPVKELLR